MLIPMNVDGGGWDDKFINSTKLAILLILMFLDIGVIAWSTQLYIALAGKIVIYLILAFITQWVIRFLIFEEKYYYRMYKKMQQYKTSNPSVFWNIAMMKDTDDGAILVYSDGKVGILVRLERDTITGKQEAFRETHFDAISDFYRELNLKGLSYIQMNIMEVAGKDPRLAVLDKLVVNPDNKNISKLIESEVAYIKKITRATLFESDYVLIYTTDMNRSDTLISDAIDCIYKILEGGFIGYSILTSREILERVKEEYGVKYFDYTEATVNMYKNNGLSIPQAVSISGINYTSGKYQEVDNIGRKRLITLASYVDRGILKEGEWSVETALQGKIRKDKDKKEDLVGLEFIKEDKKSGNYIVDLDSEVFGYDPIDSDIPEDKSSIIEDILYPTDKKNDTNLTKETEIVSRKLGLIGSIKNKASKNEKEISSKDAFENEDYSTNNKNKKRKPKGKNKIEKESLVDVEKSDIHSANHFEKTEVSSNDIFNSKNNLEGELLVDDEEDDEIIDI